MTLFFSLLARFRHRKPHNTQRRLSLCVPPAKLAEAERRFQALKNLAASGEPGCVEARRKLREATHNSLREQVKHV